MQKKKKVSKWLLSSLSCAVKTRLCNPRHQWDVMSWSLRSCYDRKRKEKHNPPSPTNATSNLWSSVLLIRYWDGVKKTLHWIKHEAKHSGKQTRAFVGIYSKEFKPNLDFFGQGKRDFPASIRTQVSFPEWINERPMGVQTEQNSPGRYWWMVLRSSSFHTSPTSIVFFRPWQSVRPRIRATCCYRCQSAGLPKPFSCSQSPHCTVFRLERRCLSHESKLFGWSLIAGTMISGYLWFSTMHCIRILRKACQTLFLTVSIQVGGIFER